MLEDIVSLCVFCREDGTVLMTTYTDENLVQFLSLSITKASWRLTVRKLISMVGGLSGKDISIMRVTKFWVPDSSSVFHILYKVKCPISEKKVAKLSNAGIPHLKWYTLDQVQQMCLTGQLSSPELLEYVAQSLQPRNFYPLTADPEATKEGFDMLNEVAEKNIIVDVDSSFLTPQEHLLRAAHFNRTEQKRIYKEFWLRTFPNLLMNKVQFDKFISELGWKKDDWPGLFPCVDISSRLGVNFRDFILFLAATEPETPHGSGSGEIRCQYIFKYYDKNRDNLLDYNELRNLVQAITAAKGGQKPKDIDKMVESYLLEMELGPKPRLSLNTFVKKVGELKFRGTSSIFRSKISVLKYVPLITATDQRMANSPPNFSTHKKPSFFPGSLTWRGVSSYVMSNMNDDLGKNKNKVFEIATHVVRLNRAGLLEEVRPIDRVSHGKSVSMGGQDYFIRLPSMQYYDEKSPVNELLSFLEFFTNESGTKSRKQPYSWGKIDISNFASTFMTVCEKCVKILEKEPRMLQVSSPVYIMGDLHGNYPDLMAFEQILWSLGLSLSPCSILFLGDYVDRGLFGVEIVAYLFAQKVKNPSKVFLLRGNHEIRTIQKAFTFYNECQKKFGEDQFYEIWNMINRVFDVMPLAAVIDGKLFCCHGGIPPPWLCPRIDDIDSIPCPLTQPEDESVLAWEIMWNDPIKTEHITPAIAQEMDANEGFACNTSRKTGRFFSHDALETFLRRNDLTHVIRAHEVKTAGFQVQQGGKLMTVFSSSGYCGGPNEAACIFVCQEKIRVFRINTS